MYDLIVIGGGPAGYIGAIRGAQLGFKVVCIEKKSTLGGTCLNEGCIPSKALLQSSHKYVEARDHLASHGVMVKDVSLDLKALMGRKEKVVGDLTKGIDFLFKKNKIDRLVGTAKILSPTSVSVGDQVIEGRNILIATGSEVLSLPHIPVDEKKILSSTGALALDHIPEKMVVVGGGYIGLEMGSVWQRLGSQVTIIEFFDRLVPTMDGEVAKALQKSLEKQGLSFKLSTKVEKVEDTKNGLLLSLTGPQGPESMETDVLLMSIGRKPYTTGLGLEDIGITLDERGRIPVSGTYQTSVPSVYAVGDVIAGPMLAHKAEEEAVAAVEIMAGQHPHVNYDAIPGVIYTHPEVASVGKTEEQLNAEDIDFVAGKFPFLANSRAKGNGDTEGFVKVLSCPKTDRILGVHIIGSEAGTMIAEAVLAMEYAASSEDIARTCHAHPTVNEALKEASLAVLGRAIHM